jgi:WD40 repeat protein
MIMMRYALLLIMLLLLSNIASAPLGASVSPRYDFVAKLGRGAIRDIAWHPTQNVIAVATTTGLWFYDAQLQDLGFAATPEFITQTLAWSSDGHFLALGSDQGILQIWKIISTTTGIKTENAYTAPIANSWITHLAWKPDRSQLAIIEGPGRLMIWDTQTHQIVKTLKEPQWKLQEARGGNWSPDGSIFVIWGSVDLASALRVYNADLDLIHIYYLGCGHIVWTQTDS